MLPSLCRHYALGHGHHADGVLLQTLLAEGFGYSMRTASLVPLQLLHLVLYLQVQSFEWSTL
jgi:hypothetical protein